MTTETDSTGSPNPNPADTSQANPAPEAAPATAKGEATQQTLLTETPEAGEKAGDPAAKTEGEAGDKPAEKVIPEAYEFKLPEGVTMDADTSAELTAIAKEFKLDQGEAQKVADLGAKQAQRWAEQQQNAIAQQVAEWAQQASADKEIGTPENLAVAKKALDTFGNDALRELLNTSGLGNHPEIIRAFFKAGKAIAEDQVVTGGAGPAAAPKSVASVLYDKTPSL